VEGMSGNSAGKELQRVGVTPEIDAVRNTGKMQERQTFVLPHDERR